jgi:hypothetical protein
MADLGTVPIKLLKILYYQTPTWDTRPGVRWFNVPTNGAISGTVQDETTPGNYTAKSGIVVRLYWRLTGQLIASDTSDESGLFSFSGLDPAETGAYFVLAFDDSSGTVYNIAPADLLTPV